MSRGFFFFDIHRSILTSLLAVDVEGSEPHVSVTRNLLQLRRGGRGELQQPTHHTLHTHHTPRAHPPRYMCVCLCREMCVSFSKFPFPTNLPRKMAIEQTFHLRI